MEQKKYKQINTKTPEIQEMILSYQIGGVAYELSQRLEISRNDSQLSDRRRGIRTVTAPGNISSSGS